MSLGGIRGQDWTDAEIDLIVADYFDMRRMDILGEKFVKTQRNAALQALTGRSKASIEFKHRNISAVLVWLGMEPLRGYLPAMNYQRALIEGVGRYIATHPHVFDPDVANLSPTLHDAPGLFLEAPPSGPPVVLPRNEHLERLVRKFDPVERDTRNRALGRKGEEFVVRAEHARLTAAGRRDLAKRIDWVSDSQGDGAGYDILSFTEAGDERLLEVKTTTGHRTTPFFISENERALSDERPDAFRVMRLYNFAQSPRGFELAPPLDQIVHLQPISYRASF